MAVQQDPWTPDLASFTPEEKALAEVMLRMDRIRTALKKAGDLVKLAEVDLWFRTHAKALRPIRDKLEPPF